MDDSGTFVEAQKFGLKNGESIIWRIHFGNIGTSVCQKAQTNEGSYLNLKALKDSCIDRLRKLSSI